MPVYGKHPFVLSVFCPAEIPVANGNISIVTNGTTTVADYFCAVGYELVGTSTLTCLTNGTWDNTSPKCCEWTRTLHLNVIERLSQEIRFEQSINYFWRLIS